MLEVEPERLIDRLFGGMEPDEAMLDGVRAARRAGRAHGDALELLGRRPLRPRAARELFDAWVISGEVGLRKPDPAIYELAAERLGLPPEACVFVDDLPGNLKPARALGMATSCTAATRRPRSPRSPSCSASRQPALIAITPASVSTTPSSCERATRSASTTRASTTVTAG